MDQRGKIVERIVCEANDRIKIVYSNKNEMKKFTVPEEYENVTYITRAGESIGPYPISLLKKANDENSSVESEYEKKMLNKLKTLEIEYSIGGNTPCMIYTDCTDTDMFGFPEITKNVLASRGNGLWLYHGIRKFKFKLENLQGLDDTWKYSGLLHFDMKDNDEIPPIRMEEIRMNTNSSNLVSGEYEFYVYVDTNAFGKVFDVDKQQMMFSGYFQIDFKSKNGENDISYNFPLEIVVNNTEYNPEDNKCIVLSNKKVSIDFGTSSSCVAVEGENGIELMSLSAAEEVDPNVNIYENPTCVMVYRWDEIYAQWKKENESFPIMLKGNREEEQTGKKKVEFDFGYSVKRELNQVSDKELNAIVTEIKMLHKAIAEGEQPFLRPYVEESKKTLRIVDEYEKQDDEHIDIVAFYGYILGRAINRVESNKIYTSFQVTYPVKFNDTVREKIRKSLEAGLRRSLPLPLRTALNKKGKPIFKVEMKYSEPVAYIGSVCGQYLKLERDSMKHCFSKMFAVYDFGGGTTDFSFGVFAPDDEDPDENMIYILGVDGFPNIGGELLIRKMSYWLYVNNAGETVGNNIPFEKPEGEILPDNCKAELFNNTASAMSNVKKINEMLSRKIFQNEELRNGTSEKKNVKPMQLGPIGKNDKTVTKQTEEKKDIDGRGSQKIELLDVNDQPITITIQWDIKEINQKLKAILEQAVHQFKESMINVFKDENNSKILEKCNISFNSEDDIEKVTIFKAGNASKNKILDEIMKSEFAKNDEKKQILLIDETNSDFMSKRENGVIEKQVAITPKTAVAFGQILLGAFRVEEPGTKIGGNPFNWYIYKVNTGDNSLDMVLDKVVAEDKWYSYGRINGEDIKIHYSSSRIENAKDVAMRSVSVDEIDDEDIRKYLWIRIKNSDELYACILEKGKMPDGNTENMIEIKLV